MRLRPRGSSSDLDEARAIAERLARPERSPVPPQGHPTPYVRFGGTAPSPAPVAAVETATAAAEPKPHVEAVEPLPPEGGAFEAAPERPVVEAREEAPYELPLASEEVEVEVESPVEEPIEESIGEPMEEPIGEPEPSIGAEPLAEAIASEPVLPGAEWEVAEEAASDSPLSALSDMVSSEPEPTPPPSWDSLLERARELADAQAGLLIGPDGALLAATDGWPAVGATAIATRLLPMVEPKLANPGALVPVKLAGQILSVWRFEVEEQPVTAAMLAEKALPVIVRPDIDELFAQGTLRG
jgi:hypothetical protein